MQYESNCGWNHDNDIDQIIDSQSQKLSENKFSISTDACGIVYFDSETSGFGKSHEILQIAAIYKDLAISVYVNPTEEISCEAFLHTELRNIAG